MTNLKKIQASTLMYTILLAFGLSLFLAGTLTTVQAADTTDEPGKINVLLFTNYNLSEAKSTAFTSLNIDPHFNIQTYGPANISDTSFNFTTAIDFNKIDVVVFENYFLNETTQSAEYNYTLDALKEKNIGILFFGGGIYYNNSITGIEPFLPAYTLTDVDATVRMVSGLVDNVTGFNGGVDEVFANYTYDNAPESNLVDNDVQVSIEDGLEDLINAAEKNDDASVLEDAKLNYPYVTNIAWQSCPLIKQRFYTPAKKVNSTVLIEVPDTKEPLLVTAKISVIYPESTNNASVLYISSGTGINMVRLQNGEFDADEPPRMNEAFGLWPYFNYLMYVSMFELSNNSVHIESYADWDYSPIPHGTESTIWMIFIGLLWVFNSVLFITLNLKRKQQELKVVRNKIEELKNLKGLKNQFSEIDHLDLEEIAEKWEVSLEVAESIMNRWKLQLPIEFEEVKPEEPEESEEKPETKDVVNKEEPQVEDVKKEKKEKKKKEKKKKKEPSKFFLTIKDTDALDTKADGLISKLHDDELKLMAKIKNELALMTKKQKLRYIGIQINDINQFRQISSLFTDSQRVLLTEVLEKLDLKEELELRQILRPWKKIVILKIKNEKMTLEKDAKRERYVLIESTSVFNKVLDDKQFELDAQKKELSA